MQATRATERIQTVVIGAGQAGLSVGHHLAKRGLPFIILEGNERVGDSWRRRWDSLRLFTSAQFNGLDGMPFPARRDYFPTKDEMADYLEAYAARFELPVYTGHRVERLTRQDGVYTIAAGGRCIEAEHVVVAMANYQVPRVPVFARDLDPAMVQLHSRDYRSPSQLRDGGVLIVGAGNSGAEIAMELVRDRPVFLAGRDVGQVPFRIESLAAQLFLARLVLRGIFHRVLTVATPMGRKARPHVLHIGGPLIRQKRRDLAAAGIERVPRATGAHDGRPVLADGRVVDVTNVVWCTGFEPGFSWIDLPVLDARGEPRHDRGIVPDEPGLYFVGLHFLYALSSTMIHGVGRDAARIASTVARRARSRRESPRPRARPRPDGQRDLVTPAISSPPPQLSSDQPPPTRPPRADH